MLTDRLKWADPKLYVDDVLFRLEQSSVPWDGGHEYFRFFKDRKLINQYITFFSGLPSFAPKHLFELGMFDGGSVAFWNEFFKPDKHVAVDITQREDNPYFAKYLQSRNLGDKIKTYWSTDQGDAQRLKQLLQREFEGPLDLVIDDASHLYDLTKRSFEILFPALRPGGLYVVEDWAWAHWPEFSRIGHDWANETPLTQLIFDLVEAAGTSREWIGRLTVFQGFTVVERGPALATEEWTLESGILRKPKPTLVRKGIRALRRSARRFTR